MLLQDSTIDDPTLSVRAECELYERVCYKIIEGTVSVSTSASSPGGCLDQAT